MSTADRIIRDPHASPSGLAATEASIDAQRSRLAALDAVNARVLANLPRMPLMSGDPASASGTQVALSELAEDAILFIEAQSAGGGGGSGDESLFKLDFTFLSPVVSDFGALLAGATIIAAEIIIEVPFDDPATIITLGQTSAAGSLFASNEVAPTVAGTYLSEVGTVIVFPDSLRLQVLPGVSAQGAGRVIVTVRRP